MQLVVGQYADLSALVKDAADNPMTVDPKSIVWVSSAPLVAAVVVLASGTPQVQAKSAGSATITGTCGSAVGTITIAVVVAQVPTTLAITATIPSIRPV